MMGCMVILVRVVILSNVGYIFSYHMAIGLRALDLLTADLSSCFIN